MPVLNEELYIKKCIDSIITEKLQKDEIIVIDNGSTDNTLKIISEYKNITILQYPCATIAALRNYGAKCAKGDLLAFIDGDCVICKGWRDAVERVFTDKKIHATGSIVDVSENSTWVERALQSERLMTNRKVNYINSGNFIIRKIVFEKVNGFNEKLETDEDYDIGARINAKGYYIYHDSSIRAIHFGNSKTLTEHFKRKLWHSKSLLDTAFKYGFDKAFIMTLLFMFMHFSLIVALPIFILKKIYYIYTLLFILTVPIITALYRIIVFKNYRYFFLIVIVYYVFYLARSITLIRTCASNIYKFLFKVIRNQNFMPGD